VLIEVGYISHPEEGRRLGGAEYQEKLATAITEGVKEFLAEQKKRDNAPAVAAPEKTEEASPVATPASL
jgi:N-acetylmuramoyl-L-alanine amidase